MAESKEAAGLSHAQIVEIVQSVTKDVFQTMLGTEVHPSEAQHTAEAPPSNHGVFSFIGFAGDYVGSGSFHCSSEGACLLASKFLMMEYERVDDEVLDAIAEITNMVIGNFKSNVEDSLGTIGISTPTVIYGHNFSARNVGSDQWSLISFRFDGGEFDVRVSLAPNTRLQRGMEQMRLAQRT
jgi:chemotaxis protein CheX